MMYVGSIVELAPTPELINQPAAPVHPSAAGGCAGGRSRVDAPGSDASSFAARTSPACLTCRRGCRFHPRCPLYVQGLCDVKSAELESRGRWTSGRLSRGDGITGAAFDASRAAAQAVSASRSLSYSSQRLDAALSHARHAPSLSWTCWHSGIGLVFAGVIFILVRLSARGMTQ